MDDNIIYISSSTIPSVKLWIKEKQSLDVKQKKQSAIDEIRKLEQKSYSLTGELTKVKEQIRKIKARIKNFNTINSRVTFTYKAAKAKASSYPNKIYILTKKEIEDRIKNIKSKNPEADTNSSNQLSNNNIIVNNLEKEIKKVKDAKIIFLNIEKGELNNYLKFGELPDVLIDIRPLLH